MSNHTQKLQKNIRRLYWLSAMSGAVVFIPIAVIFWQNNGLSLRDIFLLQAAFAIATLILEIPSGYISDRWGRKNTLIVSAIMDFIGVLIYSFSHGFWGFFAGELVLGIAISLASGTIDALAYDTLLELNETKKFRKIIGHMLFLRFGAEAIVGIAGGALALISLRATFFATLIPFGIGILFALTLEEPHRHKLQEERHLEVMWRIFKDTLVHNIPLRSIIMLQGIISSMSLMLFWFFQPYQVAVGIPLALFGITHGIIVTAGAFASKTTHQITKWIDDRLLLLIISAAMIISFLFLGLFTSVFGLLCFLVSRVAWSTLSPLVNDIVNRMTTSEIRATVLSVRAFINRILFAIVSPFIGYAADVYSLNIAILITGILGGVSIVIILLLMRKTWVHIPK